MATYYVHKGVGSDSNTGTTWAGAFSSLAKANAVAGNNDTVYVRAGATPYYERLVVSKNGQRWLADAGHQPVIDGKFHEGLGDFNQSHYPAGSFVVQRTGPGEAPGMLFVSGDDCEVGGFKVGNSAGDGLAMTGSNNHIHHLRIDFCYGATIIVNGPSGAENTADNLIEDSEVSRGGIVRFALADKAAWSKNPNAAPFAVCNAMKNCARCTFRRITCYHQNGEALVLGKNSRDCIIEYCTVWNNYHMNIYVCNAINPTVRFCTSWVSYNPDFLRGKNPAPTETLVFGDETSGQDTGADPSINQKVYGNILVGGKTIIGARTGANYNTRLRNAYIGYNTLVGGPETDQMMWLDSAEATAHSQTIIENNIVYAPQTVGTFIRANVTPGIRGRNNLFFWEGHSGLSVPAWIGEGAIYADPRLVNPKAAVADLGGNGGAGTRPNEAGNNFNRGNYLLTGASPAIDRAVTTGYPFYGNAGVELARQRDILGATRTTPDVGAHEYGGVVTNSVVAAFTRSPSATTIAEGTTVTFNNTSFATGTASITGQTWTVKKGGTTVATATTPNYSYTFATDGSYTVELAVTATGGLSDSEIISYTVTDASTGVVVTAAFSAAPSQTTIPQGYTIAFTDETTVQNGTQAGRTWAVLAMPGGTTVYTATTALMFYQFNTAGSFRVRLTATAATGESDTEIRDYTVTAVTTPTVTANFTASDADLVIDAGGSITFTNTTTVLNTTISGYVWTVTALEGGGETTYTTTNITHTFPQAGLYQVRLLANTAAGVSNERGVIVTVRQGGGTGTRLIVAPVRFAASTSTGTQTVTAAALGTLVPKGVHIRLSGGTAANTAAADALLSDGASDGSSQWVHTRFSKSAQAAAVSWRRYARNAVMLSLGADGAQTGRAALVRFVPGGMELNVSDGFPAGYLAEAVFYAGDDCQFWAGTVTVGDEDEEIAVPTGFLPAAVYGSACWATQEDVSGGRAELSMGWATAAGGYCIRNEDREAKDPTMVRSRWANYLATTNQAGGNEAGAPAFVAATGFGPTGFAVAARGANINLPMSLYAFGTGGAGVQLVAATLSTSSPSSHPLLVEAQTVMGLTTTKVTDSGASGGAEAVGQGTVTHSIHGSYSGSVSVGAADNAATTSTYSLAADGLRAVNAAGGNLYNGATATDVDSLDIAWTAAPALAYKVIFLAVEKVAGGAPDTKPVASFTQEIDFGNGQNDQVAVWFDSSTSNGRGYAITSYWWDFGDGGTSAEASPLHIYTYPGQYDVSLTVTTSQGSDTLTKAGLIAYEAASLAIDELVGVSQPLTSGGPTKNEIVEGEENEDNPGLHGHTHAVLFPYAHFEELDEAGVAAFLAMPPDPVYALWAWDGVGNRALIKRTDGTHRAVATTAV